MQYLKHSTTLITIIGAILLIIFSQIPWFNIPEIVKSNFETGSFYILLNLIKFGALLMGILGIIGTVLCAKKQKRVYAIIGLVAGIITFAGMIILVLSMSASVRRILNIDITMAYYFGLVSATVLIAGSVFKFFKK